MGNPFQDQFLKAGLVSKKQVKKVKHEKRHNRKQNKEDSSVEVSRKARQEQEAQAQRNRELNLKYAEENRLKEQNALIKQLIQGSRLDQDERGQRYNFVDQKKIKRIFVSEEMADQLSLGQLAIVKFGNGYEVVPAKVARQIIDRDREFVVAFHEGGASHE
ncbi:MAG: DUF2058 domain-containing protein [Desulfobulbaceae bacterium]|uniref:DUF2058 domain-containing protein n=1 Tax=Candidatus Desulfatifera sulfidica TaxID=2841691 RepID=A0A8J6NCW0_9BACT|nr:DUF2058 domain-containing protein [Candidatus Desulfatifera sulfidica]